MKKIIPLFVICMMALACFAKQNEPVVTITPTDQIEMKFLPGNEIWFIRHYIKDSSSCATAASSCNLVRNEVLQYESFKVMPDAFSKRYSTFSAYKDFINGYAIGPYERKYTKIALSNDFFRLTKTASFTEKKLVFDRYKKQIYTESNDFTEPYFSPFVLFSILAGILCGVISACGDYSYASRYKARIRVSRNIAIAFLCIIGIINLVTMGIFPVTYGWEWIVIILGFIYVLIVANIDESYRINLISSIALLLYIAFVHVLKFEDILTPFKMFVAFAASFLSFSFWEGNRKWVKISKGKLGDFRDWVSIGILKRLAD